MNLFVHFDGCPQKCAAEHPLTGPVEGLRLSSPASNMITWYTLALFLVICMVGVFVIFIHVSSNYHCLSLLNAWKYSIILIRVIVITMERMKLFWSSYCSMAIVNTEDQAVFRYVFVGGKLGKLIKVRPSRTKWEVEVSSSRHAKKKPPLPSESDLGPSLSQLRPYILPWRNSLWIVKLEGVCVPLPWPPEPLSEPSLATGCCSGAPWRLSVMAWTFLFYHPLWVVPVAAITWLGNGLGTC